MSTRLLRLGVGGADSGFTPADVPETLLWFDSNMTTPDMTLNVDKVKNLGDADLTQVTQGSDAKRLVRTTAGDGKLELTCATDDEMTTVSNLVLNPCTFRIFSVFKISAGGPVIYRIVSGSDEITLGIGSPTGDIEVERGGVRSVYSNPSPPWQDGTYHRLEHVFADGTNTGHTLDVDEVPFSFSVNSFTGDPGTASFTAAMTICAFPGFFFMTGAWRFLAVCAPEPSAADAALIRAYMLAEFF